MKGCAGLLESFDHSFGGGGVIAAKKLARCCFCACRLAGTALYFHGFVSKKSLRPRYSAGLYDFLTSIRSYLMYVRRDSMLQSWASVLDSIKYERLKDLQFVDVVCAVDAMLFLHYAWV